MRGFDWAACYGAYEGTLRELIHLYKYNGMKPLAKPLGDLLARALPQIQGPAGSAVSGRVANSPNAYDDVVEELESRPYGEIIIETPPSHISHWLHVDLPHRISELGYSTLAVAPAQ